MTKDEYDISFQAILAKTSQESFARLSERIREFEAKVDWTKTMNEMAWPTKKPATALSYGDILEWKQTGLRVMYVGARKGVLLTSGPPASLIGLRNLSEWSLVET